MEHSGSLFTLTSKFSTQNIYLGIYFYMQNKPYAKDFVSFMLFLSAELE